MSVTVLTADEFVSINPVIPLGDQGIESDTLKAKTGDGVTAWRSLAYTSGPLAGRSLPENLVIAGDSYLDPLGVGSVSPGQKIDDRLTAAWGLDPGRVSNIAVSGSLLIDHFSGCSYAQVWRRMATRRAAAPYTPNVAVFVGKWGTNDGIRGDDTNQLAGYRAAWRSVVRACQSGSMYPHNDATVTRTGTWTELLWASLGSEPYDNTAQVASQPWGFGTGCWRTRTGGSRVDIAVPADHTGTVDLFLIGSWFGATANVLRNNVLIGTVNTEHLGASWYGSDLYDRRCGVVVTVSGLTPGVSQQVSLVVTGFTAGATAGNPSELRFNGWAMRCLTGSDPLVIAAQTPIVPNPGGFWAGVTPKIVRSFNRALRDVATAVNGKTGSSWPMAIAATQDIATAATFPDGAGHPNNAGSARFAGEILTAYTRSTAPGSAVLPVSTWETPAPRSTRIWKSKGAPGGVTDDFNRANSTTTLGGTWAALRGVWGINGNAAYPVSGIGNPFATDIAALDVGLADLHLTVTAAAAHTVQDNAGIAFRIVDADNYLSLVQSATYGGWTLRSTVAGSIVDSYSVSGPWEPGTVTEVVCDGPNISIYFNGLAAQRTPFVINQFLTATKVGFVTADATSGSRWDSLVATPAFRDVRDWDYYLDTATNTLYGPYATATGWPTGIALGGSGGISLGTTNPSNLAAAAAAGTASTASRSDHVHSLAGVVRATGGGVETVRTASVSGALTVNLALGNVHNLTLTGNVTGVTFSGATSGSACSVTMYLRQDATGGRTVTWPSSVKWAGGAPPSLTTTANAVNVVTLETLDGGTTWYGTLAGAGFA